MTLDIELGRSRRRAGAWPLVAAGVLVLVPVSVVGGIASFRTGDPPAVEIVAGKSAIGPKTPITIEARAEKRGLQSIDVELIQGERVEKLESRAFLVQRSWALWEQKTASTRIDLVVGKENRPWLIGGEATIRVTAQRAGTWLVKPEPTIQTLTLPVQLTPPIVAVISRNTFAAQGGSEAVLYQVSATAVRDGVRAGRWWFPGFQIPGQPEGQHFAFFAAPYDMEDASSVRLVAADDLGNEATAEFIDQFKARPFKTDTIEVTDKLMGTVVPAIMSQTPTFRDRGSLLANYVGINSELRKLNGERLEGLAKGSQRAFLWSKAFVPMQAKVISSFADRRAYRYGDKEVDRQDHLGIDLASTQKAPVPASNDGLVMLAEYLGIYGNAVVIDHGYGLMTLYGHLSSMDVKPGQKVTRGEVVGHTGTTGLALGDHLHFTMLLQGLPVTPIEWWDDHWIHDRIALKFGSALPYNAAAAAATP